MATGFIWVRKICDGGIALPCKRKSGEIRFYSSVTIEFVLKHVAKKKKEIMAKRILLGAVYLGKHVFLHNKKSDVPVLRK